MNQRNVFNVESGLWQRAIDFIEKALDVLLRKLEVFRTSGVLGIGGSNQ